MSKAIKIWAALLLTVSLLLSFSAGCALGSKAPPKTNLGLDVVQETWELIFQDYVDRDKLDANVLSQAAIKGMVEALDDPHTAYLDPDTYRMMVSHLEAKFEGIGAFVETKDGQLMVVSPIPDSPAAKAGIRSGDKILEIDGRSTSGMSLEEGVRRIRGPKGTSVQLLILHLDETKPEKITIVRAEIKLPSVYFEMREDVAYLNISYFSEHTDEELSTALKRIDQETTTGIVLDLRSNAGGILEAVVDIASHFLPEGTVTYMVDNQGKQSLLSVKPKEITTRLPMVVLTDNYSASGSEVLAGALQDYNRATIAGSKTYGKGSVNTLHRLKDGSGLYLTTARWLTPKGRLIEGEGINPDYELNLKGEDAIQWAINYLKDNK